MASGLLGDVFGSTCTTCGDYIAPDEEHDCKGCDHVEDQYITSDEDGNELRWCNTCDEPIKRTDDGNFVIDEDRR